MIKLEIQDCLPAISKEEALEYGERHGIYMPEPLAIHLSKHNGGNFHSEGCIYYGSKGGVGVGQLHGIDERYAYCSIQFKWDWVLDQNPDLTPIASDAGGHPFVLWKKKPERVFYFDKDKNRPTSEVSPSIVHFMESIALPIELERDMLTWPKHERSSRLCNEKEMLSILEDSGGVDAAIEGESMLYWAGLFGNPFSIRWLLQAGADPNKIHSSGASPLHAAADSQSIDCCRVLVENGARIDAVDSEGRTPLLVAIAATNVRNAELLLEKGANATICDKLGKGAAEYAAESCSASDFSHVFQRVGAKF